MQSTRCLGLQQVRLSRAPARDSLAPKGWSIIDQLAASLMSVELASADSQGGNLSACSAASATAADDDDGAAVGAASAASIAMLVRANRPTNAGHCCSRRAQFVPAEPLTLTSCYFCGYQLQMGSDRHPGGQVDENLNSAGNDSVCIYFNCSSSSLCLLETGGKN